MPMTLSLQTTPLVSEQSEPASAPHRQHQLRRNIPVHTMVGVGQWCIAVNAGDDFRCESKCEVRRPEWPCPFPPNYLTFLHEILPPRTRRQQSCATTSPTRSGASF